MKIVFRVDSSVQMGSGHLMRCLTLATALHEFGAEIVFVSRLHSGHLIHKIEAAGYVVHKLLAPLSEQTNLNGYEAWLGVSIEQDIDETLSALNGQIYDWMVVDHYALDAQWERAMRIRANHIMVIDDLANRQHDCDLLLDQNYFGEETASRYDKLLQNNSKFLLGPQFALLKPEYEKLRITSRLEKKAVESILIFFGNTDATNQTGQVLQALSSVGLNHLFLHVVVGSNHPNATNLEAEFISRGNIKFYYHLPTLADLMLQSDLFIGAGGGTTWERLCLGCPALVASLAENQELGAHFLSVDGYQVLLDMPTTENVSVNGWKQAIEKLVSAPVFLNKLTRKGQSLVDGLGCKRVVLRLLSACKDIDVNFRDASAEDKVLLLDWANDSAVRKQSFCQDFIKPEAHAIWFKNKLMDQNAFILIGEASNGLALGVVRFDLSLDKREALIGISVDSFMRGMGLAKKLLAGAMMHCFNIVPDIRFIAEVREANLLSRRLFEQLRFVETTSDKAAVLRFEYAPKMMAREGR